MHSAQKNLDDIISEKKSRKLRSCNPLHYLNNVTIGFIVYDSCSWVFLHHLQLLSFHCDVTGLSQLLMDVFRSSNTKLGSGLQSVLLADIVCMIVQIAFRTQVSDFFFQNYLHCFLLGQTSYIFCIVAEMLCKLYSDYLFCLLQIALLSVILRPLKVKT